MTPFFEVYKPGCCKMPKGFSHRAILTATSDFLAPSRIDLRDLCTPTEDQGPKPWCAAHAAAQWAENIEWRVSGRPGQIAPDWIYAWAKQHDGYPDEEGTTLTEALEALRGSVFDRDKCRVKVVRPNRLAVKFAIHKFGCVLGGFNIDGSWGLVSKDDPTVAGDGERNLGGHAVLICGYDKRGVWIQNSWGKDWGEWGFAKVPWAVFDAEFLYGAVLSNVLDDMTINT